MACPDSQLTRIMTPPFLTASALSPLPGLAHGFFGRRGGVSTGIYASLNAGAGSNDVPACVTENRARISAALGCTHLLSLHQVHSPEAVIVSAPFADRPHADGMVTATPGLGLCILSADCTPVLFADPQAGIIGAAHAGWKGAVGGVLEATLARMVEVGAARERIIAAIGPVIRQESYEVGPEFRDSVLERHPEADSLFKPGRGDRLYFDLPGLCKAILLAQGVAQIEDITRDTCADEENFFSNRRRNLRSEPDYGRNASVIVLKG